MPERTDNQPLQPSGGSTESSWKLYLPPLAERQRYPTWIVPMCFVLYMAADAAIPDIPFNTNAPALNTHPLSERESPLHDIFRKRNVKFLGSSNHCGCEYRHLSFQNGDWPEEYLIGTDPEFSGETQADHEALYRFMVDQLQHNDNIELYGIWDGDFQHPPARHEMIGVDELIIDDFFLRERCHCTVTLRPPAENVG